MKTVSLLPALPTVGRIVLVTLSADLAGSINRDPALARANAVNEGESYPLLICRVWSKDTYSDGLTINGQLFIDGVGSYWLTSVHHGDEPGCWHWPKIEGAEELRAACAESAAPLKNASGDIAGEVLARDDSPREVEMRSAAHQAISTLLTEIARLKDELQRVRTHETHLIQDRDRLIHGDLAILQKHFAILDAEHKELTTQLAQRSQDLRKAHEHGKALEEKNADLTSMVRALESRNADLFTQAAQNEEELQKAKNLLAKVRAVDGDWMDVFDELRKAGN